MTGAEKEKLSPIFRALFLLFWLVFSHRERTKKGSTYYALACLRTRLYLHELRDEKFKAAWAGVRRLSPPLSLIIVAVSSLKLVFLVSPPHVRSKKHRKIVSLRLSSSIYMAVRWCRRNRVIQMQTQREMNLEQVTENLLCTSFNHNSFNEVQYLQVFGL